jgi:hypothetical protein
MLVRDQSANHQEQTGLHGHNPPFYVPIDGIMTSNIARPFAVPALTPMRSRPFRPCYFTLPLTPEEQVTVDYPEFVQPVLPPRWGEPSDEDSSDAEDEGIAFGAPRDPMPETSESERELSDGATTDSESDRVDDLPHTESEADGVDAVTDDEGDLPSETMAVFEELIFSDSDSDCVIEAEQEAILSGEHYRRYQDLKTEVEAISRQFQPQMARGELSSIFRSHLDLPRRTLFGWHVHWIRDPEWRPYASNRRLTRMIFSAADEEELMAELRRNFWMQERRLSSRTFADIVLRFWRARRRSVRRSDRFCGSALFEFGSAAGMTFPPDITLSSAAHWL